MRVLTTLLFAAVFFAHELPGQQRPPIVITRLFTGADGQTHAEKSELRMQPSQLRAGLDESEALKLSGGRFLRWPRGYEWGWHNTTARQYVITISGRSEVEVAGGRKIVFNPGDIALVEDVTGKGHTTRSTGSEDLVLLLIPVAGK